MNNQMHACLLALCAALATAFATASEAAIVQTNFQSTGSRQSLNGTTIGLSVNQPGGTWVWGAGWNWGSPFVPATWDPPGIPTNLANLAEEDTALGISIASSGSYTKPTQITLAADLRMHGSFNNTTGLGFWSAMPLRADGGGASSTNNFTGLIMNEVNGTLQVYAGGSLVGSAVSVGSLSEGQWYNIRYDVNTLTGAMSNVMFGGNPASGFNLPSNALFTNSATAFAGALTGGASRAYFNNFVVSEISTAPVPEPASLALLAVGGLLLVLRRRGPRRSEGSGTPIPFHRPLNL